MAVRPLRGGLVAALLLLAAACATRPAPVPAPVPVPPPAGPVEPAQPRPAGAGPSSLPSWGQEDHLSAFRAYVVGCGAARENAARSVCADARRMAGSVNPSQARAFFEQRFALVEARTDGAGLLTAYFAPEYAARRSPDAVFDTPVLGRPDDLVSASGGQVLQRRADGSTVPYPDRAAIEASPSRALAWMRAEDLFFMQIQGSGYLTFEDGSRARAAFAAHNGQPFAGIARPMADRGLLPRDGTSGDAIRAWLAAHRGPEADAVMALNPRYVFFDLQADDGGDPAGAAGVALPARRAVAIDPASWSYGDLIWIEADGGNLAGARASYRGLVMALDTGGAIRGPVRADLYMGRGEAAGSEAGAVRHPLRMWRLVPR